ncbi:diguanylate cyclase domain-containing protein [Priestia koreensis]|uniref:diguanylate cyclase domain-containing protein n=1 Tax=Priestia koreensis TaxID=284581 RepID=UPI00203A8715|nr:diguanylate cyclase [Priestia koreensis]MCM3005849.1 diguanylate cyclase [Priestia koreensis]
MYLPVRDYKNIINLIENLEKKGKFTITLIDIDHFHSAIKSKKDGIEKINYILKNNLSENTIYIGKDEFILVEMESLDNIFIRLVEVKSILLESMGISFSAGIAEYPKHGEDYIELLRNIEEALYVSKIKGRNKLSIVDIKKMKLKSNYYTPTQLSRLTDLSVKLDRSEASLLRESLDELIRKYEE